MSKFDKVMEHMQQHEVVELAASLVRIPGHYKVSGGETAVAEAIRDYLEGQKIPARLREVFDGRCNVYGSLKGSRPGKTLLLCGHIDTVLPDGMEHEPFAGEVREGRLWGRGAVDMKGGVAAMLAAMAAIRRSGVDFAGEIRFAGVVGEESPNNSEGARALVQDMPPADYGIIGEATGLKVAVFHKGMSWLRVDVRGKASHASKPENGVNAISGAARMILALEETLVPSLREKTHPHVSVPTISIGRIEGGMQNNIVPEHCWFSMDRRYIPGESISSVKREIEECLKKVASTMPGLSFVLSEEEATEGRGTLETGEGRVSAACSEAGRMVLGEGLPVGGVDYWTDGAHLFAQGTETVVLGPGNIAQAHSAVEYVDLDQLTRAAEIYAAAALELLEAGEEV